MQCSSVSFCLSQFVTGARFVENCIGRSCFSRSFLDSIYTQPASMIKMPLLYPYSCFVLSISFCQSEKGTSGANSHFIGRLLERIGFHPCGVPVLRANEQVLGLICVHIDCPFREDTPFRSSSSTRSRCSRIKSLKLS